MASSCVCSLGTVFGSMAVSQAAVDRPALVRMGLPAAQMGVLALNPARAGHGGPGLDQ